MEKEKDSRAKKAIKKAFIELYGICPIEKISVTKVIEKAEYSRSVFYFHYDDIYDLLEEVENDFLTYIGNYFDFNNRKKLEEDIEAGAILECNVQWFEKCLQYKEFLTGALSGHGNPMFEVKLRKKLREEHERMGRMDGIPDDFHTKFILEYQIEGLIGVLRVAVYEKQEVKAEMLAEVSNTLRKYWHFAHRKIHGHSEEAFP